MLINIVYSQKLKVEKRRIENWEIETGNWELWAIQLKQKRPTKLECALVSADGNPYSPYSRLLGKSGHWKLETRKWKMGRTEGRMW